MIYKEIVKAKNGADIPVFTDGKSFHSKYNPEREAQQLAQNTEKNDFFLATGLGAAFHIRELHKKFPDAFILAVENSAEDIDFLTKNLDISDIFNENIKICTLVNLEESLQKYYLPAKYSNFSVFTVNSWIQEIDKSLLLQKSTRRFQKFRRTFPSRLILEKSGRQIF